MLRKLFTNKRRKQRLVEEIRRERDEAINAIEQKRLDAERSILTERNLLAEERNKYLSEIVAIVQTEASMVREITGKDFLQGLERIKAVLNIEQATIDNLIAKPSNASDGNRPSNTNSKEET